MGNLMLGTVQRVAVVCSIRVYIYMESLLPSFLPSFLRCPELHDNHSKVLSACYFSRDKWMTVFHCVGVYWGSLGTWLLKYHEACSPTLPYRCQLMQQLLHDDAYLKQMWQTAIQWLQYEMEKVCYGKLFIQNTIVYACCWQAVLINCSLNHPLIL